MSQTLNRPQAYTETRREPQLTAAPVTVDVEARTAELIVSTGAAVQRYFGQESVDVAGIGLRGGAPVPLVDTHNIYSNESRYGLVLGLRVEGGNLLAKVQFDRTPAGDFALQLALAGTAISFGYRVDEFTDAIDSDTGIVARTVTRCTLLEISFVPVGADPGAFVRGLSMSQSSPAPAAPAIRTAAVETPEAIARRDSFRAVARAFNLPEADGDRAARVYLNEQAWRGEMMEARAAADDRTHISNLNSSADYGFPDERRRGRYGEARSEFNDRIDGLAHRAMPSLQVSAAAREFANLSLADHARELLEARGVRDLRRASAAQIFDRYSRAWAGDLGGLHGTDDFPGLLTGAGNRMLLAAYDTAPNPLKMVARRRRASDFRTLTSLRLGNHEKLEKVNEHGEVKNGTIGEEKQTYQLATYAKIFGLTRQALINDDLNAFADFAAVQGRAAAETEADLLVTLLTSNPVLEDTYATFATQHGNLAASGGTIDVTTLSAARLAMRTQKANDGVTLAPASPKYLVVGPARETVAEQVLTALNAAALSDVNPFAGKLELLVEPRLTGNAWYLFADPAIVPVIEYAYLDAAEGPQFAVRDGFRVMGTEFRVSLDFGAGIVDWRGAYKNAGA